MKGMTRRFVASQCAVVMTFLGNFFREALWSFGKIELGQNFRLPSLELAHRNSNCDKCLSQSTILYSLSIYLYLNRISCNSCFPWTTRKIGYPWRVRV